MTKPKFPVLAVILLIFALTWFFSDIGYLHMNIPWIPIILGIIAVGMIFNRFRE
ncbi:hypothetical protein K0A97_01420 [Patescibacteria group bacterium]|nr:hypothetical protein [Patescibacteria group bacterium]